MTARLTSEEAEYRIKRVLSARGKDRSDFCALIERAGLDPSRDLRFGNFAGVDFIGCNLRGYDFSGSILSRCLFRGALISGAKFSQCEYARARETAKGYQPSNAQDWREAFRNNDNIDLGTIGSFDFHIMEGVCFRDFAFSPLMRCIQYTQQDGAIIKLAVAVSNSDVYACRQRWESDDPHRPNRMRDYIDSLNFGLKLERRFRYEIANETSLATKALEARLASDQDEDETETLEEKAYVPLLMSLMRSERLLDGVLFRRMRIRRF